MAVELAELIGQLRAELIIAMQTGEKADLQFELGPVELELTVAVDKRANAGTKVRFLVVEASADGTIGSSSTQKIKLTLDPRVASRPGRPPLIAGDEDSGEHDDEV